MGKSVLDVMSSNVRTARPDDWVSDAARAMKDEDVGSIPVVDGDRLVAILTDRDIVVRTVAEGVDPGAIRVGEIASTDPVTVEPGQSLGDALELMALHQVRRLPVVEGERLVGMLAQADVALEAKDKDAGEMLAEISEAPAGRT
jgi:CBS domain-containing protein